MTMANAPLWGGTAGDIEVIWANRETEYFCKQVWTGQIRLICFDKSPFRRIAREALIRHAGAAPDAEHE
jgi:hypothetical protein